MSVLLLVLGGCGVDVRSASDRVTPEMLEACPSALLSEIAAKLSAFEILRDEGLSSGEGLLIGITACSSQEQEGVFELLCDNDPICVFLLRSECDACNGSVIDFVWR